MKSTLIAGMIIGAVIGITSATIAPRSAHAAVTTTMHVYSGTHYSTSSSSCGWHVACLPTNLAFERGLDWTSGTDSTGAYMNLLTFSADFSPTARGHGVVGSIKAPGFATCPSTSVDVRNNQGVYQVRLFYLHSDPTSPGSTITIYAQHLSFGGHWTGSRMGAYNGSGCSSTGVHIHTWFAGLVPGVINIITGDNYAACTPGGAEASRVLLLLPRSSAVAVYAP